MIHKKIIECDSLDEEYGLEKHILHSIKKETKASNLIINGFDVGLQRINSKSNSIDISKNIIIEEKQILTMNTRWYRLNTNHNPLTCICYIHGGAFSSGSLDVVDNLCKRLAELSKCSVVSLDYPLAPENPFPSAIVQSYDVCKYIIEHTQTFNILASNFMIMGDSAGANIAIGCSYLDVKEKNNYITYQTLLYPVVDMSNEYIDEWNIEAYGTIKSKQMSKCITSLKECEKIFQDVYLQGHNPKDPLASSIYINDIILPPTTIVSAQYDYLRIQIERMVNVLSMQQIQINYLQYNGLNHAFVEMIGIIPQADHCLKEIIKIWRNL